MKCPKCGYMRQARDDAFVPVTECPSCGIVYSKHETISAPTSPPLSATHPPHLRPSAVDPQSLKKARERVEKRLRERMEVRPRDDKYEQTLELAKKITDGSIHGGHDPVLQALEQKLDNTPKDLSGEKPDQTEDPVLLEEMVGVQIHSDKGNATSKAKDESRSLVDQSPVDTSVKAPAEPEPDAAKAEAPVTETTQSDAIDPELRRQDHGRRGVRCGS